MSIYDQEDVANKAKLYEIAAIVESEFFMESIKEQIAMGLDCSHRDYLKEFEIKLKHITEKYDESDYSRMMEYRDELYASIVRWIEERYDVTVQYDNDEIFRIVKQLYRFFVVDLKDAIRSFLFYYIRENYKAILKSTDPELLNTEILNSDKAKDIEDTDSLVLMSNIGTIVDTVIDMGLPFETFIQYAAMSGDILSINELNSASNRVLFISSEEGVFQTLMKEMKSNSYDHNIIADLSSLLISSFIINKGDDVNDDE